MAARKRGLGRGLDALLGENFEPDADAADQAGELHELALDDLQAGRYQPRTDIDDDALESLAQSIRTQGVLQPLVVRPLASGYEIVAGERRWRAAHRAGLSVVPAVVRPVADEIAMAVALIENIQREDLNPLEEAAALQRLMRDCNMTHQQCADAVGRSRASVSNLLRLTELDAEIQRMVREGRLEMGHARALLGAREDNRLELARKVVARGLSVRQTEQLVKNGIPEAPPPRGTVKSPRLAGIERELAEQLGTRVAVKPGQRGGKVEIRYRDIEQLQRLVERFGGKP